MALLLKTKADCPVAKKSLIAGLYNDAQITVETVERGKSGYDLGHPLKKCPVLIKDGEAIFESNAMARFVAKQNGDPSKLYGATPFEAGQIDGWIDLATSEIDLPVATWLNTVLAKIPNNLEATKKATADCRKVLMALDNHLATRTFLVRDRMTLADICVVVSLLPGYVGLFDGGFRKALKNVNRWFSTCVNQPHFIAVLGPVALCDKKPIAPAPPKKEEAKKEEVKVVKKEVVQEAPKPKKAKPFSTLPPSDFNMNDFKVKYSNEDTRSVALPYLYENFDKEGWSLYLVDYKYPEDLKVLFMTCNLLGGFCQRVEGIRDFVCGSFLIFGEDKDYKIHGAVLLRGKEWPEAEMADIPDVESYKFTKVNLEDPEEKAFFEDIWAWEGKFKGLTFTEEGKIMK